MISRYEVQDVSKIWTDEAKFTHFLTIELTAMETLEEFNLIPKNTSKHFSHVKINPKRIEEIEEITRHDVIAFCSSITEQVSSEVSKYFHYGVTSSDIIDTALSLQIRESLLLQIKAMRDLRKSLEEVALKTKDWMTLGRSHGMYAEPMSFGQKFLSFSSELKRRIKDTENIYESLTLQLSGSIGNYALISPEIEASVANKLNLLVEDLSTQVIPRDHHAKIFQANALTAAFIERVATEIRHLHRSDVGELAEGFRAGQKGSSIMPHKKNPISAENLSGLSRILRSHAEVGLQNVVLWHERDISHSSAERMIFPDNFGLMVYALRRLKTTIDSLELYREKIEARVFSNVAYLSSYYMHLLIEKLPNIPREEIYALVQKVSFNPEIKTPEQFTEELSLALFQITKTKVELTPLKREGLMQIYMKHVDKIFKRCLAD
jgi:adenylosuccinate lyase